MDTRRFQNRLRRLVLGLSLLGAGYLFLRFDLRTIPEQGCSPLLRFVPGDRLILDRWGPDPVEGEALLFDAGPEHGLQLGRVVERAGAGPEARFWLEGDRPDCPMIGSAELGWIGRARVRARVILSWPW